MPSTCTLVLDAVCSMLHVACCMLLDVPPEAAAVRGVPLQRAVLRVAHDVRTPQGRRCSAGTSCRPPFPHERTHTHTPHTHARTHARLHHGHHPTLGAHAPTRTRQRTRTLARTNGCTHARTPECSHARTIRHSPFTAVHTLKLARRALASAQAMLDVIWCEHGMKFHQGTGCESAPHRTALRYAAGL